MISRNTRIRAVLRNALLTGLCFLILGWLGMRLSRETHDVSIIWVATSFAICAVLRICWDWRECLIVMSAVFVGSVLANLLGAVPLLHSVAFSAINIIAIATAFELARRFAPRRFITVSAGLKFLALAGVLPAIVGAACAGIVLYATNSSDVFFGVQSWALSNLLGFVIVAPLGMTISMKEVRKLKLTGRKAEAAATAAMIAGATVAIFLVPQYTPLFLVIPAGLWATFRFRLIGASVSVILIGVTALVSQRSIGSMTLYDPALAPYIFQLFLAVCVMAFVPVAAILNQRDFHIALIERRRQRAMQANKFKSQLLSHVSHEVRTPLSAIVGFGSLMEGGMLAPEKAPEFAGIITRNGELLARLHDDLMDFARAESGTLKLDKKILNAADVLETFIRRQLPQPESPVLMLQDIDTTLAVSADPLRLTQIMNNLVGNAQRYGDGVSPVVISARRLDAHFGRIEVINTGPGIQPEHRHLIFQPFSRVTQDGPPGSGLGLSITKMLVESHGGRIDFDSVPNGRTRFWIDLPLAA